MRFMVIVKADKNSEAGVLPSEKILTERMLTLTRVGHVAKGRVEALW